MNVSEPCILLVDDEPLIRMQLSRALGTVGIECDCAVDGEDALVKFEARHYPLVVTDLRMPQRHGHSLFLELSKRKDPPKVIALTGVTEPWMAKELRTHGITEVVYKPVDYFAFASHLKQLLDESYHSSIEGDRPGMSDGAEAEPISSDNAQEQFTISRWMFVALRWLDWRRLENPPGELYQDLANLPAIDDGISGLAPEPMVVSDRIGIGIALNDRCEPVDRPFKFITQRLTHDRLYLVQSASPQGQLLGAIVRASNKRRSVLLAKKLEANQLTHGFHVVYQVLNKG